MELMLQKFKTILAKQKESTYVSPFFFLVLFFSLIFTDQFTKNFDWFGIKVFRNYFFAFSLPVPVFLMYFIYAVVLVGIFGYFKNYFVKIPLIQKIAWVLILAGGLSNIVERVIFGYVVDWVYLFNGVFNLADFYIIAGILLLLISDKKI